MVHKLWLPHLHPDWQKTNLAFAADCPSGLFQTSPLMSLQAVTAMGFKQPTPIQKACVPVGLLGRDLCACAATGTGETDLLVSGHYIAVKILEPDRVMKVFLSPGKTAAFMLPVLERLVYKPRTSQVTRVLVLVPTRELGIQVHSVARQLAQFTSITTCLAVGMKVY